MKQAPGSIVQTSFVVSDLKQAAKQWADAQLAGPFFLLEHLDIKDARYLGEPTHPDISIALGYSGGVCVELIEQHNDAPSVYSHAHATGMPTFHHIAVMTDLFDNEVKRFTKKGAEVLFEGAVAVGGRFAYLDTQANLGGLVELIELSPVVHELFATIEQAAENWQGEEPLRSL